MPQKIKIVIADDNPNICSTLKDILTEKEFWVETVKNGYELLLNLRKGPAQIIILDLVMPAKDGIEILSTIKSIAPKAKIIIYTGFKKYENSVYAGIADKFLLKGENPEKLLEAIQDLAGRK